MFAEVKRRKMLGEKVGFTCSTFDLLHAGHITMLTESKNNCDFLVVGLMTDPTHDRKEVKSPPVQTILERWIQLQALSMVDLIIPFDSEKDLYDLLLILQPDRRFVGEEYVNSKFTGYDIPGIEIFFNQRKHRFSTTELKKRVNESEIVECSEYKKIRFLEDLHKE